VNQSANTEFDQNPEESFRKARVEHYLRRAEECIQMARYKAASEVVDKLLVSNPGNQVATSLRSRLDLLHASVLGGKQNGVNRKGHHELVMVVDQDEEMLMSLTECIRQNGYRVVAAAGYDEAMDTLAVATPDVIISEINFASGPKGFDLYLWVRTNAATQEIPFLFLATRLDRDVIVAGKRLGVDDFMPKPLDEDIVLATLNNRLARRRQRKT
jgi:PleD family two-component response regulator